jgi:CIC family chloride channel protein
MPERLARRHSRMKDVSEPSRAVQLIRRLLRSETRVLFTLTVVVGCLSGLAAVGFHLSIDFVANRLLEPLLARSLVQRVVLIPLLLIVVGLLVGVLLDRVVPFARGSGIPEVKAAYVFGPGAQLSLRTVVGKFVLGALSIGAGFSLGREGPTVQICAAIGAAVGRATRRPTRVVKALISVGAAAGIAAAFNTPIAAITFAMEEVIGDLNQRLIGAIVVASVAAAVVERAILGGRPSLLVPGYSLGAWQELFAYGLLGVLAGLGATVFVRALLALRLRARQFARVPRWAQPAMGGALMAAIGLLLPETFGIGYPTLSTALLGQLTWQRMVILSIGKTAATVVSYGSGLAGGIFAPALFIGATLGGSVAHLVHPFAGPSVESVGSFALVGMGAFFAGAIRAPITSILIIFEMTGDYSIILPLMISNVISYTVAARLHPVPIYDALLRQDGVPMPEHETHRDLRALTVEQAMRTDLPPARLDDRIDDVRRRLEAGASRAFAVVDPIGRLEGIVGRRELANGNPQGVIADVVNRQVITIFSDQSLDLALLRLGRHAIRQAPVVSRLAPEHVVGMLSLEDIAAMVGRFPHSSG